MGQEDYLNSLLDSIVDPEDDNATSTDDKKDNISELESEYNKYFEETNSENNTVESIDENYMNSNEMLNKEIVNQETSISRTEEIGDIGDIFAEEEPLGDVFTETQEVLGDIFAETKESLGDVFEAEEPLGDVFAEAEEPLGDVLAEEEEPLGDVFAEAEEPLGDVFVEEEEPLGDVLAEEEELLGDVFAEAEEPLGDVFAEAEEPLGDIFAEPDEKSMGNEFIEDTVEDSFTKNIEDESTEVSDKSDPLLNSIDDLLSGVEGLNFDEEELTNAAEGSESMEMSKASNSFLQDEVDKVELEETVAITDEESNMDNDKLLDNESGTEEDIFSMFNSNEGQVETLDFEDMDDGPIDKKSLFDDDLMKLLGEEDLSSEDIIATSDEDELLKALENKDKDKNSATASDKKDGKQAKKGGLFSKLFKKNNKKSAGKAVAEDNEEILEELAKEDKKKKNDKKGKAKKDKKPKKEKAPKKEKGPKPEIITEPSVPLHKGQVVGVFVLCISIGVFIMLGVNLIPYDLNMNAAKRFYEREQYEEAYSEIEGLSIKEKDSLFYQKIQSIMILNNQLDTYQSYDSLNLKPESLNALLKGVAKYDQHYAEAQQYGVSGKYDSMLEQITNELNNKFGVSIDDARAINALETQEEYSAQIYNISK